ncbi:hypothetical protein niasHS_004341 [Heterodera schachtii]|uniref:Uncharacterized protein n=1 Tax=Heterodera schachtii TaxID=97005 RepID=A0ABD2K0F7_HETSC
MGQADMVMGRVIGIVVLCGPFTTVSGTHSGFDVRLMFDHDNIHQEMAVHCWGGVPCPRLRQTTFSVGANHASSSSNTPIIVEAVEQQQHRCGRQHRSKCPSFCSRHHCTFSHPSTGHHRNMPIHIGPNRTPAAAAANQTCAWQKNGSGGAQRVVDAEHDDDDEEGTSETAGLSTARPPPPSLTPVGRPLPPPSSFVVVFLQRISPKAGPSVGSSFVRHLPRGPGASRARLSATRRERRQRARSSATDVAATPAQAIVVVVVAVSASLVLLPMQPKRTSSPLTTGGHAAVFCARIDDTRKIEAGAAEMINPRTMSHSRWADRTEWLISTALQNAGQLPSSVQGQRCEAAENGQQQTSVVVFPHRLARVGRGQRGADRLPAFFASQMLCAKKQCGGAFVISAAVTL